MKKALFGLAVAASCVLAVPAQAKDQLYIINACYLHARVAYVSFVSNTETPKGFTNGYLKPGDVFPVQRSDGNPTVHIPGKFALVAWNLYEEKITGKGKNRKVEYTQVRAHAGDKKVDIDGTTFQMTFNQPVSWGTDGDSAILIICPPESNRQAAAK